MRYRLEFSIYPRTMKSGKTIFYYRTYDEDGERTSGKTTGKTSRTAAKQWCQRQLKQGNLRSEKEIKFSDFSTKWWDWDTCQYVKNKRRIGRIGRDYVAARSSYLRNHVKPYFDEVKLSRISVTTLQNWLSELKNDDTKNLSLTTINHCLNTLKIMLKEAEKQGVITKNPCDHIEACIEEPKKRGFLTEKEEHKLFNERQFSKIWQDDFMHYAINLLASHTGLRMGEILALKRNEIYPDQIHVNHAWSRKEGLKSPKNGEGRKPPIEPIVYDTLKKLMSMTPHASQDDFIFYDDSKGRPIASEKILCKLYAAFKAIGITEQERKKRNIVFHSWRHSIISRLQAESVSSAKIMAVVGHRSPASTEGYTTFSTSNDFDDVRKVQRSICG